MVAMVKWATRPSAATSVPPLKASGPSRPLAMALSTLTGRPPRASEVANAARMSSAPAAAPAARTALTALPPAAGRRWSALIVACQVRVHGRRFPALGRRRPPEPHGRRAYFPPPSLPLELEHIVARA